MAEVERITAREAHELVAAGRALLVCAYEDPKRFAELRLEGAISIQEFRARRSGLPRDQTIIFYCAWSEEATSAGQAAKNILLGFPNSKALLGGVDAWRAAGLPLA